MIRVPATVADIILFTQASSALAHEAETPDIRVSGSAAITSDHRFRGVSYVDTDISRSDAAYLQPSFSKGQDGTGSIADGAVVASLTAAF